MMEQMKAFRSHLEEFALKHRKAISEDPLFRAQFHKMCATCGVDPLASNKGFWAEVLGFGDFYYQLGVQIVEACLASRASNGGLIELSALCRAVRRRRGERAEPVSEDDVLRALGTLRALGGGWDVLSVGAARVVRSVPTELNRDHSLLLELAGAGGEGWVTAKGAADEAGWEEGRAQDACEALLREGIALVDDGAPDGVRRFYFTCLQPAATAASTAA